jgi:hypothetical protein
MLEATTKSMDTGTGGACGGYVIPQEYLGRSQGGSQLPNLLESWRER